jgi:hypothetical protein
MCSACFERSVGPNPDPDTNNSSPVHAQLRPRVGAESDRVSYRRRPRPLVLADTPVPPIVRAPAWVCALADPRTDAIRHIGCSRNLTQWFAGYCSQTASARVKRPAGLRAWLDELAAADLRPRLLVLEDSDVDRYGLAARAWLRIGRIEGWPLLTEGGTSFPRSSCERTQGDRALRRPLTWLFQRPDGELRWRPADQVPPDPKTLRHLEEQLEALIALGRRPDERTDAELDALDPWERSAALHTRLRAALNTEVCWYCGNADSALIVEHRTPRSRGGSHHPGNLCWACRSCNSLKRDMTVEEWRRVIAARNGITPKAVVFFGEQPSNEHLRRYLVDEPPAPGPSEDEIWAVGIEVVRALGL